MGSRAWNNAVMTHKEIGDELGILSNSVWVLEKRAIKKFKAKLYERFGDRVTIEDLLPYYSEEDIEHEMPVL